MVSLYSFSKRFFNESCRFSQLFMFAGNYVATVEGKQEFQKSDRLIVRIYTNWELDFTGGESKKSNRLVRARIAGVVTPSSTIADEDFLDMIEIPISFTSPIILSVCQVCLFSSYFSSLCRLMMGLKRNFLNIWVSQIFILICIFTEHWKITRYLWSNHAFILPKIYSLQPWQNVLLYGLFTIC